MNTLRFGALLLLAIGLFACKQRGAKANRVVIIQPLGKIPADQISKLHSAVKIVLPHVYLRQPIPLPAMAYYKARNRYRADSLLHFLARYSSVDTVIIGITEKDISTTKNKFADWGVMGLGNCPGNVCVAATFRLSKASINAQLYKVAIHELGHTQGLPHCLVKSCFMRDANGSNPINEETDFCPACKSFLINKGWQLK